MLAASGAEIESVRQLIADHPGLSRRRLSAKLRSPRSCSILKRIGSNVRSLCRKKTDIKRGIGPIDRPTKVWFNDSNKEANRLG